MINLIFRRSYLFLFLPLILSLTASVSAQKRDNMTDAEDMQVRDAQEIDLRMKAYAKIINRRLFALNTPNAGDTKQSQKDINKDWGELRTGTTAELFWDIRKTLDEAISKIDDTAERDMKNPLFGKAVHILADGCKEWMPQFKTFADKETSEQTRGLILNSTDSCTQIIEASGKVSKEVPKEKKKKS